MKFLIIAILCLAHSVLCAPSANNSFVRVLDNGEKQYYLSESSVPFLSGYERCRALGMQLVTVPSASAQSAVEEALKDRPAVTVWTSAIRLEGQENFSWLSTGQSVTYTNWADGYPSTDVGTEACVAIQSGSRSWNDKNCSTNHFVLCESV